MATPEELAFRPETSPDLRVITGGLAVEQTVEFVPEYRSMTTEEYKAYVHWTALTGDNKGTSLKDLLAIDETLSVHQREIASETAKLTVSVSNSHIELASADDKHLVIEEMVTATERLSDLHRELLSIQDKKGWLSGYLKDREPQQP